MTSLNGISNYSFDGMDDTLTITTIEGDWHFAISDIDAGRMHLFFEHGNSNRLHLACSIKQDTLNEMIAEVEGDNKTVSQQTLDNINIIANKLWKGDSFKSIFG